MLPNKNFEAETPLKVLALPSCLEDLILNKYEMEEEKGRRQALSSNKSAELSAPQDSNMSLCLQPIL